MLLFYLTCFSTTLGLEKTDDEPCSFLFEFDDDRPEPFFAMVISTKRLMTKAEPGGTLEIDETFKVLYENFSVTLIGQSDADRKFHLLALCISTNSTEEVGNLYLSTLLREIPGLLPTAYLGDAAEAFANAFRAIWPLSNRLMCFAHVHKVSFKTSHHIFH